MLEQIERPSRQMDRFPLGIVTEIGVQKGLDAEIGGGTEAVLEKGVPSPEIPDKVLGNGENLGALRRAGERFAKGSEVQVDALSKVVVQRSAPRGLGVESDPFYQVHDGNLRDW
jgi:hypothetical protein